MSPKFRIEAAVGLDFPEFQITINLKAGEETSELRPSISLDFSSALAEELAEKR